MQIQNKKQIKLVPIKPHFSALRKGQRNSNSLSASKGRKYFKTIEKKRIQKEDEAQIFRTKNPKQIKNEENDYGFNKKANKYVIEALQKNLGPKNENFAKKDQLKGDFNMKILKRNRFKQSMRSSKKSHSYDSILKTRKSTTPNKKSFLKTNQKDLEPPSPQMTIDTRDYEKTMKALQQQNQYYEGLYANSQQRIEALRKAAQEQKKKYQRVKQIYQQKLNKLTYNKQVCQKNLGHIFSYDNFPKDIVPTEVIVQNSLECSAQDLSRTSRKNSDFNISKISSLSVNSR